MIKATIIGIFLLSSVTESFAIGTTSLVQLMERETIHLSELKELNIDAKQGHGPVWVAVLDDKSEVWFWYQPGLRATLGFGKVVLIAKVKPGDENNGEILWPASKRGRDYGMELRAIYGK
jgi:hypothetical protein